jgi:hypothetical protein
MHSKRSLLMVAAAILSLAALAPSVSASSPRSGELQATKECSGFTGLAGSYCTITSSNFKAIPVHSTILYLQPDKLFTADGSDVVLDVPGHGNNKAFGNCSLAIGHCDFWGGTGKFTRFHASLAVSTQDWITWSWDGTYWFSSHDGDGHDGHDDGHDGDGDGDD